MGTHRLEALTDSVFAVAMTLLVLDLQAPSVITHESLGSFLLGQWPHYIGYVICFVVIALIWLQHHWVFRHLRRLDSTVFVANIVLMGCVVVLPFVTSTFADYWAQHQRDHRAATVFFGLALTVTTAILSWLWWWIARHESLRLRTSSGRTIALLNRRFLLAPALFFTSTILAVVNAAAGVIGYATITVLLLWLLRPGALLAPG